MTQPSSTPAPASSSFSLLKATRGLAVAHGVVAVAILGMAVWMFVAYALSGDEDNLAGLALLFGAVYVVLGFLLLGLALGALRSRTPGGAYRFGLGAGLFLLFAAGPAAFLLLLPLPVVGGLVGALVTLTALALVVCSVTGLVSKSRR